MPRSRGKNLVNFNSSNVCYDFTTASTKAYGNNLASLFDGKFGILNGDVNQDGTINLTDLLDN